MINLTPILASLTLTIVTNPATTTGLVHVELIALAVFLAQMAFSIAWLRFFKIGPLEWIWSMLTYNTTLPLLSHNSGIPGKQHTNHAKQP